MCLSFERPITREKLKQDIECFKVLRCLVTGFITPYGAMHIKRGMNTFLTNRIKRNDKWFKIESKRKSYRGGSHVFVKFEDAEEYCKHVSYGVVIKVRIPKGVTVIKGTQLISDNSTSRTRPADCIVTPTFIVDELPISKH